MNHSLTQSITQINHSWLMTPPSSLFIRSLPPLSSNKYNINILYYIIANHLLYYINFLKTLFTHQWRMTYVITSSTNLFPIFIKVIAIFLKLLKYICYGDIGSATWSMTHNNWFSHHRSITVLYKTFNAYK